MTRRRSLGCQCSTVAPTVSVARIDRANAAAYLSRLKDARDRKQAAAGISPAEVKP
jgi:hypothetical protein